MSTARTARRRRKQAAMGKKGLEQVYGKRRAPRYPLPMTAEVSARREAAFRMRQQKMQKRKHK